MIEQAKLGASSEALNSVFIISDDAIAAAKLARDLREQAKLRVEYDFQSSKIKKQMDKAFKKGASHILFYLADERESGDFKIKNIASQEEQLLSLI